MATITPRKLDLDMSSVPRRWLADNATATAISNGFNLLLPIGERQFVRSVRHFLPRISDPELRAQVKGFAGQEGRHASAHDDFTDVLRAQGYQVDAFLDRYARATKRLQDLSSPELRLAVTAAAEHYTAILAEETFSPGSLDQAVPEMQALLGWHAAEEIEHKAVAFDVLRAVDPSYALRMRGLAVATAMVFGSWISAAVMLMRQDGRGLRGFLEDRRRMNSPRFLLKLVARGLRAYVRRDFHPNDIDNTSLAAEWFAARGLTMPAAA